MRYYVNVAVDIRLEGNGILPGIFGFQTRAILVDETTGLLCGAYEPLRQIGEQMWKGPMEIHLKSCLQNGY